MKIRHKLQGLLALSVMAAIMLGGNTCAAGRDLPELGRVSVHDPSIFKTKDGKYYVFGSHTAIAASTNLMNWKQINTDYGKTGNVPFYGDLQETFEEPFQWAGYNDADCTGNYAVWAPDIIWNPYYKWENGEEGAYMLYTCESSTWRRSCISYLVSKTFDGTYEYGNTIIYSGFTQTGETDGNSTRDTKWDNDYLNLKELTEKGSTQGGIDEVSENWFDVAGGWNHNYAPNAIDPTVLFDADGERMYMLYGSWSGGLYLLELDRETGDVIYPGVDGTDEISGNYIDRYFGIHLAGGNHQSGEGPYIIYDEETQYYYLYETYGGLTASGGYNMRVFRSKDITGPYLDAEGRNAADNGNQNVDYGIKLMGNYSFTDQIGKRSAGHNSVLIDDDGNRYLVYHQRFDMAQQLEAHEVRVHQQFLNEDEWPVPAVYEYRGQTPAQYTDDEVAGAYEYVNHGTDTSGEMIPTLLLNLNADGSISGAEEGVWEKKDSGKGYDYLTITLAGGSVYKGYFFRQSKENTEGTEVMTFAALGSNNECIWGSKANLDDAEMLVKMATATIETMIPDVLAEDFELPTELFGAEVQWASDNEGVFDTDGIYHAPEEDGKVVLTATVTCKDASQSAVYKLRARKEAELIAEYDFEDGFGDTTAIGNVTVIEDEERGKVLSVQSNPGAKGENYLQLPGNLFQNVKAAGFSVAMWVKIGEKTFEHSALFEADQNTGYPMTRIGANLIARINALEYSDVTDSMLKSTGNRDVWQYVVYAVDENGIRVYLNGELIGQEKKDLKECFRNKAGSILKTDEIRVGSGAIWGDEDCQNLLVDDIRIYYGRMPQKLMKEIVNSKNS